MFLPAASGRRHQRQASAEPGRGGHDGPDGPVGAGLRPGLLLRRGPNR